MKISIIIPNYNGAELLRKNLPGVHKAAAFYQSQTKNHVEIIVSDDHSHDSSKVVVTELSFPVIYLEHQTNSGFSTNVNRAVEKSTGDIVVLLNTDVLPSENFLLSLTAHFSNEQVFAVGCLDKSIEKGNIQLRGRGVGRWERGFLLHGRGDVDGMTTLWASGGSAAFRRKIWDKLHGLYPVYNPFYWEDIDLSYRAQKAGYLVLFEPKSIVTHMHEEGSIKTQFSEKNITKTSYRNQCYFVWLNITDRSLIISHLLWLPVHIVSAVIRGNMAMVFGVFAGLYHLPTILKLREKNKKYFTQSDAHVLTI